MRFYKLGAFTEQTGAMERTIRPGSAMRARAFGSTRSSRAGAEETVGWRVSSGEGGRETQLRPGAGCCTRTLTLTPRNIAAPLAAGGTDGTSPARWRSDAAEMSVPQAPQGDRSWVLGLGQSADDADALGEPGWLIAGHSNRYADYMQRGTLSRSVADARLGARGVDWDINKAWRTCGRLRAGGCWSGVKAMPPVIWWL